MVIMLLQLETYWLDNIQYLNAITIIINLDTAGMGLNYILGGISGLASEHSVNIL